MKNYWDDYCQAVVRSRGEADCKNRATHVVLDGTPLLKVCGVHLRRYQSECYATMTLSEYARWDGS